MSDKKDEINTSLMLVAMEIEPGKEYEICIKIIDALYSIEGVKQKYTEVYKKGAGQRIPTFLNKIFPINKLRL